MMREKIIFSVIYIAIVICTDYGVGVDRFDFCANIYSQSHFDNLKEEKHGRND